MKKIYVGINPSVMTFLTDFVGKCNESSTVSCMNENYSSCEVLPKETEASKTLQLYIARDVRIEAAGDSFGRPDLYFSRKFENLKNLKDMLEQNKTKSMEIEWFNQIRLDKLYEMHPYFRAKKNTSYLKLNGLTE